jgi:hypothetical protein
MSSARRQPAIDAADAPRTRRDVLRAGAAASIAALLGVLGIATSSAAKNGDAIRAGSKTTASKPTTLESGRGPALLVRATGSGDAVALRGASGSATGIGVLGEATSGKGESAGVQGTSASPAGVAGRFSASGGGTAVDARANQQGVALRTKGRLELTERSGVTSVSGGAEFVIPVAGGLSDGSIVLATLQDHNPGIHIEAANVLDAEEGLIVVRLNQALPRPGKVGWLVLD